MLRRERTGRHPRATAGDQGRLQTAGAERRYRAVANEVWQAYQRFAAQHPVVIARPAWAAGRDLQAGRILYEGLPVARRPRWASGLLRVACTRVAPPAEVTHVLALVDDASRWAEARDAFLAIRDLSVDAPSSLRQLAEVVAKVVYNASGASAPFDHHAGWRLAPYLRVVIVEIDDAAFTREAEAALFDLP